VVGIADTADGIERAALWLLSHARRWHAAAVRPADTNA
jgi:hypothetical protein